MALKVVGTSEVRSRPSVGCPGGTCYGAEKTALECFTQGLAAEIYPHGVSVTVLSSSQVVAPPGGGGRVRCFTSESWYAHPCYQKEYPCRYARPRLLYLPTCSLRWTVWPVLDRNRGIAS